MLMALLMLRVLSSCVIDPLYQPHWDTGLLNMTVLFGLHSADAETSVPESYLFGFVDGDGNPPAQSFVDIEGHEVVDRVSRKVDTLTFEGYLPPSRYHLYSYAETEGFRISADYAEVETDERGWVLRRPQHLFAGAWTKQIDFSQTYVDTLQVRQHTRDVVFRIVMSLGDSLELVSSDVRLTNVAQRLNMADGSLMADFNTTMQLALIPRATLLHAKSKTSDYTVALVDTIRMLSPSPEEYATGRFTPRLSVRLNFRHTKLGMTYAVQPVDCSFDNVLDDADTEEYRHQANYPYCIRRYVWQCPDTVRFRMVERDTIAGEIRPWDIVTDFGKM